MNRSELYQIFLNSRDIRFLTAYAKKILSPELKAIEKKLCFIIEKKDPKIKDPIYISEILPFSSEYVDNIFKKPIGKKEIRNHEIPFIGFYIPKEISIIEDKRMDYYYFPSLSSTQWTLE